MTSPRQRVTGIGGFFFRSADTASRAEWYADHLGVEPEGNPIQLWQPAPAA